MQTLLKHSRAPQVALAYMCTADTKRKQAKDKGHSQVQV